MPIDHEQLSNLVSQLYRTVGELEQMFPGRKFTPDGHLVGSLGECLIADAFDLELMPASNAGYDAVSKCGKRVEIKATQANSVAFRSEPEHVIAIRISKNGSFEVVFNGPGSVVWRQFEGKPLPKNGQYQISLSRLRKLNENLSPDRRLVLTDNS